MRGELYAPSDFGPACRTCDLQSAIHGWEGIEAEVGTDVACPHSGVKVTAKKGVDRQIRCNLKCRLFGQFSRHQISFVSRNKATCKDILPNIQIGRASCRERGWQYG